MTRRVNYTEVLANHTDTDKEAIDKLSPGDAVIIFTPDSQCDFR